MLSSVNTDWPEITVKENTGSVEGATDQKLIFRVGGVFALSNKPVTGIWVNYHDGNQLYGPVLIDYSSWKKVNKHIRKRWRWLTWPVYTWTFSMFLDYILRRD
jgi:hypothetical protein